MPADLFFFSLSLSSILFPFFFLFFFLLPSEFVYISFHFLLSECVYVLVPLVGSLIQTARRYRTVWCLHHHPPSFFLLLFFFPFLVFLLLAIQFVVVGERVELVFNRFSLSLSLVINLSLNYVFSFLTFKMREGKQKKKKRIADRRVHTQTDTNEKTIGFLVRHSLSSVRSRVVMSFDRRPAVFFFFSFLTVDGYSLFPKCIWWCTSAAGWLLRRAKLGKMVFERPTTSHDHVFYIWLRRS